MSRVVVVGGGYGGLASAARLAKLGHEVTLLEAADRLGGAIGFVEEEGFRWDSGPTATVLPAVLRDLFRKSGRPLDREVELVPVEPLRQHRFEDGTRVDLPGASRAAQIHALDEQLGSGTGAAWAAYVDQFSDDWEALRRDYLERPFSPDHASKHARALLATRLTLHKHVQRTLKDERLRELALHTARMDGHDPRNVPAWMGMWSYVEQTFGAWTVPGGMGSLADVLAARLRTRGVTVLLGTPALDLEVAGDRVTGVRTPEAVLPADHVVCAIDPRRLPVLARHVERTMPAIPPVVCHIGVVGPVPELPHEVAIHGDPTLVLRTGGVAPDGAHAWTLMGRGKLAEDIVTALQRAGIRVRDQVEVRVDRSPRELVETWGGSPYGVLWQGRRTVTRRLGPRTPIAGVLAAGAHATPGAGLPSVGLSAALVAQEIGPA
ncbi:MAG TPA: FAD-dependent oxidoreductase [Marmoricola sp.]|nr:FAD-dependent oxidoreductase [Marmoricola sp.]